MLLNLKAYANFLVNSKYIFKYQNVSCDPLSSNRLSNGAKCIILCELIKCKKVSFDNISKNCSLFYGRPELIKFDFIPQLNLNYILGYLNC